MFFGEAGAKGLSLLDVLSRRYDVVVANPPYLGSKHMAPILKHHVDSHFSAGKRDLYASFILQALRLAADDGRVAMVTQHSWMFLDAYEGLRHTILTDAGCETMVELGARTFADLSNTNAVGFTMFVIAQRYFHDARGLFMRLVHETDKERALIQHLSAKASHLAYLASAADFLALPGYALFY